MAEGTENHPDLSMRRKLLPPLGRRDNGKSIVLGSQESEPPAGVKTRVVFPVGEDPWRRRNHCQRGQREHRESEKHSPISHLCSLAKVRGQVVPRAEQSRRRAQNGSGTTRAADQLSAIGNTEDRMGQSMTSVGHTACHKPE